MRKLLAKVGIGSATVETVLESTAVTPGGTVDATVRVRGGGVEQRVDRLDLVFETRYRDADGERSGRADQRYRSTAVGSTTLAENLILRPDTDRTRNVSVDVPGHTPVTFGNIQVWVDTVLDVPDAVDPGDRDHIEVRPGARMDAVLNAAESLGLSLHTADCEVDRDGVYTERAFFQEFEYRPTGDADIDAEVVEFVFDPVREGLKVYLKFDAQPGAGTHPDDEFLVEDADPDAVAETLRTAIAQAE